MAGRAFARGIGLESIIVSPSPPKLKRAKSRTVAPATAKGASFHSPPLALKWMRVVSCAFQDLRVRTAMVEPAAPHCAWKQDTMWFASSGSCTLPNWHRRPSNRWSACPSLVPVASSPSMTPRKALSPSLCRVWSTRMVTSELSGTEVLMTIAGAACCVCTRVAVRRSSLMSSWSTGKRSFQVVCSSSTAVEEPAGSPGAVRSSAAVSSSAALRAATGASPGCVTGAGRGDG
eukprot:5418933-Prymnesium_polylepis.1